MMSQGDPYVPPQHHYVEAFPGPLNKQYQDRIDTERIAEALLAATSSHPETFQRCGVSDCFDMAERFIKERNARRERGEDGDE